MSAPHRRKTERVVAVLLRGGGAWWLSPDGGRPILVQPSERARKLYADRWLLWNVRWEESVEAWVPTPERLQPESVVASQPDGRLPSGLRPRRGATPAAPRRVRLPGEGVIEKQTEERVRESERLAEKGRTAAKRTSGRSPEPQRRCTACKKTLPVSWFSGRSSRCATCATFAMRQRPIRVYRGGLPGGGKGK
jgi:hypothetical protein